ERATLAPRHQQTIGAVEQWPYGAEFAAGRQAAIGVYRVCRQRLLCAAGFVRFPQWLRVVAEVADIDRHQIAAHRGGAIRTQDRYQSAVFHFAWLAELYRLCGIVAGVVAVIAI